MRTQERFLTTDDAYFEVKHSSEFIEARRLLAKALRPIAPATAEALADEEISLNFEERSAVNALTILLLQIYNGEN